MSSPTGYQTIDLDPEAISRMEELGIVCVPVNYFCYGGYRYTQLKDAIAQAEHQRGLK